MEVLAKPLLQDRKYPSGTPKAMLILKIRSFARGSMDIIQRLYDF